MSGGERKKGDGERGKKRSTTYSFQVRTNRLNDMLIYLII